MLIVKIKLEDVDGIGDAIAAEIDRASTLALDDERDRAALKDRLATVLGREISKFICQEPTR